MSSMINPGRLVVLAAVLCTTAAGQSGGGRKPAARGPAAKPSGQADGSLIVLPQKPDFVLWDGDKRIEPGTVGLVYSVEQVDRFRLLLTAPGHGLRGWSPSSEVISLKLAEEYFTHAITIRPGDPYPYMMRGIVRSEKDDAKGALADLDEALKRDPKYVPALVRRASLLRAGNQHERALADVDRAIVIDGREPSAYVERGVLLFTRKAHDKAWNDLDRATSLGSREVIVEVIRGQILLETKDTKKAYEAFVRALKVDPRRHDAYLGLASVYLMRGQAKTAQSILDDAVRADPDNPEAYGNRATLHLARGDYEKALFNLGEVIRLSPGSARAYNERAWLLATCPVEKYRDFRQAVEEATRACELTGWSRPRYLATLAAACSETGDFDAAARSQEKALALLAAKAPEKAEYQRLLDRYRAKKPHHGLGLLEELGIKTYQPAGRSPG
jgi:tetratricopeptide (TPR) repeat protein